MWYNRPFNSTNNACDDRPPTGTNFEHACLTLNRSDRLRLIRFPMSAVDAVREAIINSWARGLKKEKTYAGAYEFRVRGNPWFGQGVEAVDSRILMMSILAALHHNGWYLSMSTDVSKKDNDKDALIFRRGDIPPPTSFFAVSFNEWDKLRLIGAPPELLPDIGQMLGKSEIQNEHWVYSRTAYQFRLRGQPWAAVGEESVTSRIRLLNLLDCLTSYGWQLHASVDMSMGQASHDTDTWFFRHVNP